MAAVTDYLGLDDAIRFRRLLLMFGRASLQIAKYFHPVDNASERRVQAV